jgi:hypothetical protein
MAKKKSVKKKATKAAKPAAKKTIAKKATAKKPAATKAASKKALKKPVIAKKPALKKLAKPTALKVKAVPPEPVVVQPTKTIKGLKKAAALAPIDTILNAIADMGYTDPRDGGRPRSDSNITDWFRRVSIEDTAAHVPSPGRNGIFVAKIEDRLGIILSITSLIAGEFPTPQHIADLA